MPRDAPHIVFSDTSLGRTDESESIERAVANENSNSKSRSKIESLRNIEFSVMTKRAEGDLCDRERSVETCRRSNEWIRERRVTDRQDPDQEARAPSLYEGANDRPVMAGNMCSLSEVDRSKDSIITSINTVSAGDCDVRYQSSSTNELDDNPWRDVHVPENKREGCRCRRTKGKRLSEMLTCPYSIYGVKGIPKQ